MARSKWHFHYILVECSCLNWLASFFYEKSKQGSVLAVYGEHSRRLA
jgi:hypothetical protein